MMRSSKRNILYSDSTAVGYTLSTSASPHSLTKIHVFLFARGHGTHSPSPKVSPHDSVCCFCQHNSYRSRCSWRFYHHTAEDLVTALNVKRLFQRTRSQIMPYTKSNNAFCFFYFLCNTNAIGANVRSLFAPTLLLKLNVLLVKVEVFKVRMVERVLSRDSVLGGIRQEFLQQIKTDVVQVFGHCSGIGCLVPSWK